MVSVDDAQPDRKIHAGQTLPSIVRKEVCDILVEFKDIFSWTLSNLGTISQDIAEHKLGIPDDIQSVVQKENLCPAKTASYLGKHTRTSQIIKQIDFPEWLSYPVVLPKHGGEWRTFVDYTDLNKVYQETFPITPNCPSGGYCCGI